MNCSECPICRHTERKAIDNAIIVEGRSAQCTDQQCPAAAAVVDSDDAVYWRCIGRQTCLESSSAGRRETPWGVDYNPQPLADTESALSELSRLREGAVRAAAAAQREKRWQPALSGISTAAKLALQETRLLAEAADKKADEPSSVADSREWMHLKVRILRALEPYPEALRALTEALRDAA